MLQAAQWESARMLNEVRKKANVKGEKYQVQNETEMRDERI
jgi:hypothetical protein